MSLTRKSSAGRRVPFRKRDDFQHWYRDNQAYFITVRCRQQFPAFATENAKVIFWQQYDQYCNRFGFTPWVTSLMDNHYHAIGYLRRGTGLAPLMRRLHGSVAKRVNDVLQQLGQAGELQFPGPTPLINGRLVPFWRDRKHKNYFDGCLRDQKQGRLAYRYVQLQSQRHGLCDDWRDYPHTRINVALEAAIKRAVQLDAFLRGVPYKRYAKGQGRGT